MDTADDIVSYAETRPSQASDDSHAERVHGLETLVSHLLGSVSMDAVNLRRINHRLSSLQRAAAAAAAAAGSGSGAPDDDLDGLALEDESFTVKTLSQSTARECLSSTSMHG